MTVSEDMKGTRVISISLPEAQAKAAEQLAKAENRTMSELMREALRHYERQRRQEKIKENRSRLEARGIKEEDVVPIIKEWRKQQRSERAGARPGQPQAGATSGADAITTTVKRYQGWADEDAPAQAGAPRAS